MFMNKRDGRNAVQMQGTAVEKVDDFKDLKRDGMAGEESGVICARRISATWKGRLIGWQ